MRRLNYQLYRQSRTPLYVQLYQQIRQGIHAEQLQFGDKLPSKRHLCDYLQISQNTVESAYAQLLAEGYIESQPRRGFFVCFQSELQLARQSPRKKATVFQPKNNYLYDLNPNAIDTEHFPFATWQKCGRGLGHKQQAQLLRLGDNQGELSLRNEIADYLLASRGVHCDPAQIVVAAGVDSCMQQLILLFNQLVEKPVYAMESYGYTSVKKLLALYHKPIVTLPLQQNNELDLSQLAQQSVNIAFVTPSHLYPFGQVLSIGQRQNLLEWADSGTQRYIIEDDYDSEFRYKGKPIPALQSLDMNQKVIYLGSFSKLIMPALRIAFMVLPKSLLPAYQQYCGFLHSSVSRFEQQRLAKFMAQGYFEQHIQRMRKRYRKKMELLCQLLAPYRQHLRYYGEHSGFYLLIEVLNSRYDANELAQRANAVGILVYPIDYPNKCLLSLGFANLNENQLSNAIGLLCLQWGLRERG
ncbi:GntR family transcriptional regulator [Volucribacter psittacicida]|uniref:GntR family transcriptional regulator n=1 Tax=Volucribacter psittacicida TaxID=203482 RepID=A0A4R1FMJ1_9PAST|nr:PLP-dependent aminotransferase family protein [Volucribacter psittacicida]TCJ96216.1 GntR family transcriptional regulator [Volucribacter psittacicida]